MHAFIYFFHIYISVSPCLPLTPPITRLFCFLHFCFSKLRGDRFILQLCFPALLARMPAASLMFLGMTGAWEWGMSRPLCVAVSFCFFAWHQPTFELQAAWSQRVTPDTLSILRSGLWEQQLAVGQTFAQRHLQADLTNKTSHCRWCRVNC